MIVARVLGLPEIRQERVRRLKEAVESGSYHIDCRLIEDRMLQELAMPLKPD